jgi:hypothetical protein
MVVLIHFYPDYPLNGTFDRRLTWNPAKSQWEDTSEPGFMCDPAAVPNLPALAECLPGASGNTGKPGIANGLTVPQKGQPYKPTEAQLVRIPLGLMREERKAFLARDLKEAFGDEPAENEPGAATTL